MMGKWRLWAGVAGLGLTLIGFLVTQTSGDRIGCWHPDRRWHEPKHYRHECYNDWVFQRTHCHGSGYAPQSLDCPGAFRVPASYWIGRAYLDCHESDGLCHQCCNICLDNGEGRCDDSPTYKQKDLVDYKPQRSDEKVRDWPNEEWWRHSKHFHFKKCGDAKCHYFPCHNGKQISQNNECNLTANQFSSL